MIYDDKKSPPLLINPYRKLDQKLPVLTIDELRLLHRLGGNERARDICNNLSINEKLILGILREWSSKEWNMVKLLELPLDDAKAMEDKRTKYANIYTQV